MALKRRKDKKSSKGKSLVKKESLTSMLRQVHLGGVIEECLLKVKKGKGSIEAVDITNSLIVVTKASVMSKNVSYNYGLGNIELLVKFLQTVDDSELSLETGNLYFTLRREDGRRSLMYLLTQPDLIATKVHEDDGQDTYKKMKGMSENSVDLTPDFIKDYLNYIGMLKTKDTTIVLKDDSLVFLCGGTDDHQFELILSSEVEGDEDEYDCKVNGEHLAKIFSTLDYDEDDPPQLHLAQDKPVIVENDSTMWALLPLYDMDQMGDD